MVCLDRFACWTTYAVGPCNWVVKVQHVQRITDAFVHLLCLCLCLPAVFTSSVGKETTVAVALLCVWPIIIEVSTCCAAGLHQLSLWLAVLP